MYFDHARHQGSKIMYFFRVLHEKSWNLGILGSVGICLFMSILESVAAGQVILLGPQAVVATEHAVEGASDLEEGVAPVCTLDATRHTIVCNLGESSASRRRGRQGKISWFLLDLVCNTV